MQNHTTRRRSTMRHSINALPGTGLLLTTLVTLAAGCGGDAVAPVTPDPQNAPPTLAAINDRTIIMNTLVTGSTIVDLEIEDPDDDSVDVNVSSSYETVIPGRTTTCGTGVCQLTFTPLVTVKTEVTLTVTVTDSSGGAATRSFDVRIGPRRVTTVADSGAGSLRQAIAEAEAGDVIGFDSDGVFAQSQTIELRGQLVLDRDLRIDGTGAKNLLVQSVANDRVFKIVNGASVRIGDLAIMNGVAPIESVAIDNILVQARLGGCVFVGAGSEFLLINAIVADCGIQDDVTLAAGGGIATVDGELNIQDTRITGNLAPTGGGIYVSGGRLVSIESSVDANTAGVNGGGLALARNGWALFAESAIEDNQAFRGAGVYIRVTENDTGLPPDLTLQFDSRVTDNSAVSGGGGIYMVGIAGSSVRAIVKGSTVSGNTAGSGGGIYGLQGSILIQSSSVEGNVAHADGGGIYGGSLSIRMDESQVSSNRAGGYGGGLFVNLGKLTVIGTGCSIDGNTADDDANGFGAGGGVYDSGAELIGVTSAVCNNAPDDIATP